MNMKLDQAAEPIAGVKRNKPAGSKALLAFLLLVLMTSILFVVTAKEEEQGPRGFSDYAIVAHAMGGISGQAYTNTFEAFIANYEQGTRIFEADFVLTSDDRLVARHEWTANMSKLLGQTETLPEDRQGAILSYEEVMGAPIFDIFTPLDIEAIVDLMARFPDIYLVTDMKELYTGREMEQFGQLIRAAEQVDPSMLDRVVPQIYNQPMLEAVRSVYPFPEVLYTLYESPDSDAEVVAFAKETGVAITMPAGRANRGFVASLKKAGVSVYVHTLNDPAEIRRLAGYGVDGFYTDFVSENDWKQLKAGRRPL